MKIKVKTGSRLWHLIMSLHNSKELRKKEFKDKIAKHKENEKVSPHENNKARY